MRHMVITRLATRTVIRHLFTPRHFRRYTIGLH